MTCWTWFMSIKRMKTTLLAFVLFWLGGIASAQINNGSSSGGGAFSNGSGTGYQDAAKIAAPANPSSGNVRLYADSTSGNLTCLTSAGANCLPTGSGSPGGLSGTVQVNNGGAFGGITGSSFSNSADSSLGSITMLGLTYTTTTSGASNTNHAFDITNNFSGAAGSATIANQYSVLNNNGTGGTSTHNLTTVSRYTENSTGMTLGSDDAYYGSFSTGGSFVGTVPNVDIFDASDNTVSKGTVTTYNGLNFGPATVSGTGAVTNENGALIGVPGSGNAGLTNFIGVNIGNCTPKTASTYIDLMVCGGRADFESAINQQYTLQTDPTAPLTNTNHYGINQRFEVDADIAGGAFGLTNYLFGLNGTGTISLLVGNDQQVDEANVGTVTEEDAFRSLVRASGGGAAVVTTGNDFLAQTPTGSGTFTNLNAIDIKDHTASLTVTNASHAIKQEGANDINEYAGISFLNGNRGFVSSDFT